MTRKKTLFVMLAGLMVAAAMGCGGQQYVLQGAERAAGADGEVTVERQDGGNFLVEVSATNLLPPPRLSDGLTAYVVWFQAADQPPRRVGALNYDEGDRAGQMSATTTDAAFQVIVSGETAPEVVSPSEHVVFRLDVAQD